MSEPGTNPVGCRRQVCNILLGYLQDACAERWPGGDGLTLEEAVYGYVQAAAAGLVPDRRELLERHPEQASALESFFAELESLQHT